MFVVKFPLVTSRGAGSSENFPEAYLPLYTGPTVKLRVASSTKEHEIPLNLLSKSSSYFAKMFQEGRFLEGIERRAQLEDIDGVVSERSLEMLLTWICRQRIVIASETIPEKISEVLELLRIADMCDVHGLEQALADFVQDIFQDALISEREDMILPEHVLSTGLLPTAHPFRLMMAKALATIYFADDNDTFPYFDELSRCPGLSAEVTKQLAVMLHGVDVQLTGPQGRGASREYTVTMAYRDSLSGTVIEDLRVVKPRPG